MHWKIVEWINKDIFVVWPDYFKSPQSANKKLQESISSCKNKLQIVAYVRGQYSDIPLDNLKYPK